MTDGRRALGVRGEQAVAQWYTDRGYSVLAANWRCREGELDLVLESPRDRSVVVCEVKSRTNSRFGTGFDAVTETKQRRLRRLAVLWLREMRSRDEGWAPFSEMRFDVAAVTVGPGGELAVEVLQGAF